MGEIDELEKTLAGLSTGHRKLNPIRRKSSDRSTTSTDTIGTNDGTHSAGSIRGGEAGNSRSDSNIGVRESTGNGTTGNEPKTGHGDISNQSNPILNGSGGTVSTSIGSSSSTIGGERGTSGVSGEGNSTGRAEAIIPAIEIPVDPPIDTIPSGYTNGPIDIEITAEDKPKRGRGRPPGSANQTASTKVSKTNPNSSISTDTVNGLVQVIFGMAVLIRGEHFSISEEQSTAIAEPLTKILARQEIKNPAAFARMTETLEYVELGINVCAVVSPMLQQDKQIAFTNKQVKRGLQIIDTGSTAVPTETTVDHSNNGTSKARSETWGNLNKL